MAGSVALGGSRWLLEAAVALGGWPEAAVALGGWLGGSRLLSVALAGWPEAAMRWLSAAGRRLRWLSVAGRKLQRVPFFMIINGHTSRTHKVHYVVWLPRCSIGVPGLVWSGRGSGSGEGHRAREHADRGDFDQALVELDQRSAASRGRSLERVASRTCSSSSRAAEVYVSYWSGTAIGAPMTGRQGTVCKIWGSGGSAGARRIALHAAVSAVAARTHAG